MADVETKVAVLDETVRNINAALDRIDRRFDGVERRFDGVERRLDSLATEHRSDFRWLLGVMLAGFGTMLTGGLGLLGIMARGFHWL